MLPCAKHTSDHILTASSDHIAAERQVLKILKPPKPEDLAKSESWPHQTEHKCNHKVSSAKATCSCHDAHTGELRMPPLNWCAAPPPPCHKEIACELVSSGLGRWHPNPLGGNARLVWRSGRARSHRQRPVWRSGPGPSTEATSAAPWALSVPASGVLRCR